MLGLTNQWSRKANPLTRPTFFRIKRKLKDNGYIDFDFKTKTWFVVVGQKSRETAENPETAGAVIDVVTVVEDGDKNSSVTKALAA